MEDKSRPSESDISAPERDAKTSADLEDKQEDLGDMEPKIDTQEDLAIHNQIQG